MTLIQAFVLISASLMGSIVLCCSQAHAHAHVHTYEHKPWCTPACSEERSEREMTDDRSALVCNESLAARAVHLGLHKHVKLGHKHLAAAVHTYAHTLLGCGADGGQHAESAGAGVDAAAAADSMQAAVDVDVDGCSGQDTVMAACSDACNESSSAPGSASSTHAPAQAAAPGTAAAAVPVPEPVTPPPVSAPVPSKRVAAPKALADVVEALVGAVFLDSGGDLVATEKVCFKKRTQWALLVTCIYVHGFKATIAPAGFEPLVCLCSNVQCGHWRVKEPQVVVSPGPSAHRQTGNCCASYTAPQVAMVLVVGRPEEMKAMQP